MTTVSLTAAKVMLRFFCISFWAFRHFLTKWTKTTLCFKSAVTCLSQTIINVAARKYLTSRLVKLRALPSSPSACSTLRNVHISLDFFKCPTHLSIQAGPSFLLYSASKNNRKGRRAMLPVSFADRLYCGSALNAVVHERFREESSACVFNLLFKIHPRGWKNSRYWFIVWAWQTKTITLCVNCFFTFFYELLFLFSGSSSGDEDWGLRSTTSLPGEIEVQARIVLDIASASLTSVNC